MFAFSGTIVQSINGPNLVLSELISNINIAQCATVEFNDVKYHKSLRLFIHRMFSSKRCALPNQKTADEHGSIRLGRKFELPINHPVMVHLHDTHVLNFTLYETCWKNNLQFSVYHPNSTSKTCDSCVLFKEQNETNCGFLAAIFYDSNQRCNVVLHKVHIDRHDSFTFKTKNVVNPFIFYGQLTDPPHMVTVHIDAIVVKLAHSKQEIFHFYQYPNTVEST